MTTILKMKDIPISPIYDNEFYDCEEETLFTGLCNMYNKRFIKDISKLWLRS